MLACVLIILASKTPLKNKNSDAVGTIGSPIDIADQATFKKASHNKYGYYDHNRDKYFLGESFNHTYLTRTQMTVLYYITQGMSASSIAKKLVRSNERLKTILSTSKISFNAKAKGKSLQNLLSMGLLSILKNM